MSGPLRPPGFEKPIQINPEQQFTMEGAYDKALRFLERNSIGMEEFKSLYGNSNVERDKQYVESRKARFMSEDTPKDREARKLARILEVVLLDQINSNKWFGSKAKAFGSSEFDDIANGVDSIVEIREPDTATSYLALGLDVTYSQEMSRKFDRIKSEIEQGQLTTVKYLKSSDGTFRGEMRNVPRLVVGVDGENCLNLAKAWHQNASGLKVNPTRFQIIDELYKQLVAFENYAVKIGQPIVADKYRQSKKLLEPLQAEADKFYATQRHDIKDRAYNQIEQELLKFN